MVVHLCGKNTVASNIYNISLRGGLKDKLLVLEGQKYF